MSRFDVARIGLMVAELRRRRVIRTTAVYVVAVLAGLEAADVLVPALHLPGWTMTLLVVLAIAGLPVVIGLGWVFDLTPEGVRRTANADAERGSGEGRAPRVAGSEERPDDRALTGSGGVAPALGRGADEPSVAVIPFLNMNGDQQNEYFADGITEDVRTHLSRIRALRVISRTSVMPFKERGRSLREIGEALGATTVLDGSVRREGDRVRIVAELVEVESDRHLWAETYDRDLTDIFSIQTDVALHIARALRAELTPEEQAWVEAEPTADMESYQLYLKGRHLLINYTIDGIQRSIGFFRGAIARDPSFALAHASLATAYMELVESGAMPSESGRREAWKAGAEALRLDPDLPEGHCVVAHMKAIWEFDWQGAEQEFKRALELGPNHSDTYDLYGRMFAALGRFDEALALQRRAQALDPLAHRLDVATTLLRAGRYAEAETEARRAAEFDPRHDRSRATLGWALFKQGKLEEGLAELERAVDLSPEHSMWRGQYGQALAEAGREDEARAVLRDMEERAADGRASPYHLAYIHTGLGEHDRAMDLLERAYEGRAGAVYALQGSFLFAPLRSHPRFEQLLDKLQRS
jgi:adenylate cyclase